MHKPVSITHPIPTVGEPGAFGAVRKFDIHTGIDLYCNDGALVRAIETGTVVKIEDFTGPDAGSPWWWPTRAILVEGASGVIVYGEVELIEPFSDDTHEDEWLKVGDAVLEGSCIAAVKRVLKKDKGVTPTSMLHLELMKHGSRETVWWHHGDAKPDCLLDPANLLKDIYEA